MMNPGQLEDYVERIYGYAIRNTYSREEAEELSQEILLTALRSLSGLREDNRFEAWLWGLAANVTRSFRRQMGKQRAMYSYGVPVEVAYEDVSGNDQEEEYDFLRKRIAMLSAAYRDIIILHYYDGLSVKQISERLKVPEGTVTWRLSEARKRLRKGCTEMKESALRPVRMNVSIYGSGSYDERKGRPFPNVYVSDSLSQSILYHCYEEARSIEELAELCGIPAYYVEERVENLLRREAVIESPKGKYRTDFIIWQDRHGQYCDEQAERVLAPLMERLMAALKAIAAEAETIDFYRAGKSEADLFYLYGALAFVVAGKKYCRLHYPAIRKSYDGGNWRYMGSMESEKYRRIGMGIQMNMGFGGRTSYSHVVYHGIEGIHFRQMMTDRHIAVCEDILNGKKPEDAEAAAQAIEEGYLVRREDGGLAVTVPAFTCEQKAKFDAAVDRYFGPLMGEYSKGVEDFIAGYRKLFPAHLSEDVDRMCRGVFEGFYENVIECAQHSGAIAMPSPEYICDVLIQRE